MGTYRAYFSDDATFSACMDSNQIPFSARMREIVRVKENDHTKLINRDAADAHPIGAITGLTNSLNAKLPSSSVITNLEIESIINSVFGGN